MSYKPCNENSSEQVKNVLNYLYDMQGKGLITGQHTQTRICEELKYIKEVTKKQPALCGFELLSYSPNINIEMTDEDCILEYENNKGTLENIWEWANKKGLITLTWHWFSPLYGHDKSFFTRNTDFDAEKATQEGSKEYSALISDMDYMASILKTFQEKNVPIIWRPFHESDGDWFWWGAKGTVVAKRLYEIMFDRYVNYHKLNNLIWVWNSLDEENYIGDDKCDVISADMYMPPYTYSDYKDLYDKLKKISAKKIMALAEIGPLPSLENIIENKLNWSWYMMWSRDFARTDKFTSKEEMQKMYNSDYAITLDKLPKLY